MHRSLRDSTIRRGARRCVPTILTLLVGATVASGVTLDAQVLDGEGEPVKDAVVYAAPLDGRPPLGEGPPAVVIDQVDKEFVPYVTAVPVGTRIRFPNRDQIRHHVYSFSKAKSFEIPLYKGVPPQPIRFDAAGEVALGCNIHDWMRAYVFVSETPYFAVTDENGRAALGLPDGGYRVEVWHPELDGRPEDTAREVHVGGGEPAALHLSIEKRRVWRPRRAPSLADPSYR